MFDVSYLFLSIFIFCTAAPEAPDQNGGEIDEDATGSSPGPPPENGGTVAGKPKASRQSIDEHRFFVH